MDPSYFEVKKNGVSPFQNFCCYLGGSAIQTVGDNPVTSYRQLVQQYAKGADGKTVSPAQASAEAKVGHAPLSVPAILHSTLPLHCFAFHSNNSYRIPALFFHRVTLGGLQKISCCRFSFRNLSPPHRGSFQAHPEIRHFAWLCNGYRRFWGAWVWGGTSLFAFYSLIPSYQVQPSTLTLTLLPPSTIPSNGLFNDPLVYLCRLLLLQFCPLHSSTQFAWLRSSSVLT
jgi:hypothetical protein